MIHPDTGPSEFMHRYRTFAASTCVQFLLFLGILYMGLWELSSDIAGEIGALVLAVLMLLAMGVINALVSFSLADFSG